ncbi:hypothetical protein [Clostridium beijerinckii]|uniref:hypothetical protein n=1 Tax=Clostridium beijerinckii TaxID=1520 RepID=UPI001F3A640C|nr:hypothetical protein [Clostridium beijerinckii]
MKSIIYKNPVISGIIINLVAMFVSVYATKYRISYLIIAIIPVGIVNRKIIDNGIDMNIKKKVLILVSFTIMIVVFILYNQYCYNMINEQLEQM